LFSLLLSFYLLVSSVLVPSTLFSSTFPPPHLSLHSFPTRRSSDLSVPSTAAAGVYTIVITGSPAGASASSATFTLTVVAFNFSVSASPAILCVHHCTTVTVATLFATFLTDTYQPVTFSLSALPAVVTAT